jgi:hypothetical protein
MQITGQVVTITDDGQEPTRDIAGVARHALTPATCGLALAEGTVVLQALQAVVVEWPMPTSLQPQRGCPPCGKARRSTGAQHTVCRTVCGALPVASPRLSPCPGQAHATTRLRPLATRLPERTPPALRSLATPGAACMAYGLTVTLRQDGLPLDAPLHAVTRRHHGRTGAPRLEDALGEEPWGCIDSCPAAWSRLPIPDGPLTVGLAGGDGKARGEQGCFEVMAGKRLLALHRGDEAQAPVASPGCAGVPPSDQQPPRRRCEGLHSHGHQWNQPSTVLSDGGDTVRDRQRSRNPQAEPR